MEPDTAAFSSPLICTEDIRTNRSDKAFTLIELSIVLVVIGLIVGGILVGQDLIRAAGERSQISQVTKYNSAVNTFRDKFGGIPGDLSPTLAAQFGLTVGTGCNGMQGQRDGNGLIDGAALPYIYAQGTGETALFWQDLSTTGLVAFTSPLVFGCSGCPSATATGISQYFPVAPIANNSYVYVYENNGVNWFGVAGVTQIGTCASMNVNNGSIRVIDAYNIDRKIDDGIPETGNVQATVVRNNISFGWAYNDWTTTNPLNCFNGAPYISQNGIYSVNSTAGNNSTSTNCTLSFKFQ